MNEYNIMTSRPGYWPAFLRWSGLRLSRLGRWLSELGWRVHLRGWDRPPGPGPFYYTVTFVDRGGEPIRELGRKGKEEGDE